VYINTHASTVLAGRSKMSDTKYLSCADTAKLLREALKESFPGVKFGVKSKTYSGGASITVRWVDGPSVGQVKTVTETFEGSYFDGMIDYKGSRYHTVDGEKVDFAADFIFTERELSKAAAEAKVAHFAQSYGRSDWVVLAGGECSGYYVQIAPQAPSLQFDMQAYDTEHGMEPKESATLARVAFTGDDGYGAGTVGRDGSGRSTGLGYPAPRD
jgi:Large polyvalent protein associated domain 29